jgi:hypothetical protein
MAAGREDEVLVVELDAVRRFQRRARYAHREQEGVLELLQRAEVLAAGALRRQHADVADVELFALVAQLEVPHRLGAVFRDRERIPATDRLRQFPAAGTELGRGGVLACVLGHRRRHRAGTLRRVDIDAVALVQLHQLDLAGVELVLVLVDVGRVDRIQRLLPGVDVHRCGAFFPARGRLRRIAGPRRYDAVLACGAFGTDGSEFLAQLRCFGFGGRNGGPELQTQSQHPAYPDRRLHGITPDLMAQC